MAARRQRGKAVPIHAPKPRPVHPFDRLYGTDTGGLIPRGELLTGHANDAHLTAYYGVAPSILDGVVERWLQTRPRFGIERYTFLDIGAGKGRALMAASLHPFKRVMGVELNPGLAAIAHANLAIFEQSAGRLAPAEIVEGDALEIELPAGPTLALLFHPFEAPVLRKMLRRIERHADAGEPLNRVFDVLYVNAEHTEVMERDGRFARLFYGSMPMSAEDHLADLAEIADQEEYGSTGDEVCAIYRLQTDSIGGSRAELRT